MLYIIITQLRGLSSPFEFGEDDILRLIGRGSSRKVDIIDGKLFFRQTQQVVVRNGRLSGSGWTDEETRLLMFEQLLHEVSVSHRVDCIHDYLVEGRVLVDFRCRLQLFRPLLPPTIQLNPPLSLTLYNRK